MGYYVIDISTHRNNIATIVTKFGIFNYNQPLMGMCASGDIFQAKVDELFSDIQGFITYINVILVFGKESFT